VGRTDDAAAKANLHNYLKHEREAVLAKLEGLSDYDVRRPLTVTGTNLLGLVKHLATWEARYLGDGRGGHGGRRPRRGVLVGPARADRGGRPGWRLTGASDDQNPCRGGSPRSATAKPLTFGPR
jgi:hypothetical protein